MKEVSVGSVGSVGSDNFLKYNVEKVLLVYKNKQTDKQ